MTWRYTNAKAILKQCWLFQTEPDHFRSRKCIWKHLPHNSVLNVNSLAPGTFQFNFRKEIFKLTLVNGDWGISYEIAFRWMPQDLTDDKSALVQVMAWCRQATSHYLSQCWPRSLSPSGVTKPQWVTSSTSHVNPLVLGKCGDNFKNEPILTYHQHLMSQNTFDDKSTLI